MSRLPSLHLPRWVATLAAGLLCVVVAIQTAGAAANPYGKGLLWRIERPGVAASHVFGTLHSTDPRITTLPEPVTQALADADGLAVEIVQTKEMPVRMARVMVLPRGRRLDSILGPALFTRLAEIASRHGLPAHTLVRLKPWAASTAISIPAEERAGAAAGRKRLDHALQIKAQARGIPVHGLETIEEQLGVFDGLPERDQVALLKQAVADYGKLDEFLLVMKRFYLARDLGGLYTWMEKQSTGADARLLAIFKDRVINDRNRTMVARMAGALDQGGLFVAVGALHLPGERGVLNLLAARGYSVTRVY